MQTVKKADNYHFIKVKKEMTFTLIYWIINQYTLTNIKLMSIDVDLLFSRAL
jgi:hypothetical protein